MDNGTMQFRCTEMSLKDAGYDLSEGDTIAVPHALGTKWCGHGWGVDVDGVVQTTAREPSEAVLKIKNLKQPSRATVKGG